MDIKIIRTSNSIYITVDNYLTYTSNSELWNSCITPGDLYLVNNPTVGEYATFHNAVESLTTSRVVGVHDVKDSDLTPTAP